MSYNHFLRTLNKTLDKPVNAIVKGTIPSWLQGSLYRNGPGKYKIGDKTYTHLFDGLACVHKYTIKNGQVTYFNKLLETTCAKKSIADNRLYPVFGTSDICSNLFGRFKAVFSMPDTNDNTNVNVMPYANEHLYTLTETHLMTRIDPNTLSVIDTINITGIIPTATSTIAHPHIEDDGSWITVGMNLTKKKRPHYEFLRYQGGKQAAQASNAAQNGQVIASLRSCHKNGLSYFHSFGTTDRFIVFLEQSLEFNLKAMKKALIKNKPYSSALLMHDHMGARIHLIDKRTGRIESQQYITDPLFTFHHINAYETDDGKQVVVDLCSYDPKRFDVNKLTYENTFSETHNKDDMFKATACRIEIPLSDGLSSFKPIYCPTKQLNDRVSFELPVINYAKYNGKYYEFMYGVNHHYAPYSIVKLNMQRPSECLEKPYSLDGVLELPSEPVFVPNPQAQSEDDGVLLVMVMSDANDFLSILDAKTLVEIGRAELPSDVKGSMTFHGFFADNQMFKANRA